jgi:hypothetical protein
MPIFVDARIPVLFAPAATAGPGDALLTEADLPGGAMPVWAAAPRPHGVASGCVCCRPGGAPAQALRRLFLARARGEVAFFSRLVVAAGAAGEAAVRQALASDAFLAGRYRVAG